MALKFTKQQNLKNIKDVFRACHSMAYARQEITEENNIIYENNQNLFHENVDLNDIASNLSKTKDKYSQGILGNNIYNSKTLLDSRISYGTII